MDYPWEQEQLKDWSIVGMNHYYKGKDKRIYVALVRGDRVIKEEGPDSSEIWDKLCNKAKKINRQIGF